MKTTINVTQEHIDKGLRRQCSKCPVALAIKDVCKPETYVNVSSVIYVGGKFSKAAPLDVERFIGRFDGSFSVEPFSFDLDIPAELLAETK
jgi:hypothetical protein